MTTTIKQLTTAVICGLTLAACGGGSDSSSPPQTVSYTVTPSVSGGGGTISPPAPASVSSGASVSFTLTPGSGYIAGSVGGTCVGTLDGSTYTIAAVTADCTVVATFTALTFSYEAKSPSIDSSDPVSSFLPFLNQEGAKGYRYLTDGPSATGEWPFPPPPPTSIILVNDGTGQSYTYETMYLPDNAADYLDQLNAEGAKGYLYQGQIGWLQRCPIPPTICNTLLFRKSNGSSAAYSYAIDPRPGSVADFLQQANGRGQSGYLFYGYMSYFVAPSNSLLSGALYIKDNTSSATYAYEAPALSQTAGSDAWLALYNSEGARGYLAWLPLIAFGADDTVAVFVRDQTQAAVYSYLPRTAGTTPFDLPVVVTLQSDITTIINEANTYGAQGYAYYYGSYVKASNCRGSVLCTSLD